MRPDKGEERTHMEDLQTSFRRKSLTAFHRVSDENEPGGQFRGPKEKHKYSIETINTYQWKIE